MKSYSTSMGTTLFSSSVQNAAELFEFRFKEGTQRWTTADRDITSGSTTWKTCGMVYGSSSDFTGVTTYYPPVISASWQSNGSGWYLNITGITAKTGQTLLALVGVCDTTRYSSPTTITPSWYSGGNGNTWNAESAAAYGTSGGGGTYFGYTRVSFFSCTLASDISSATAQFQGINTPSVWVGTVYVFDSGSVPIMGNVQTLLIPSGGESKWDLSASSPSGTVIWTALGYNQTGSTPQPNNVVSNTFSWSSNYGAQGRYTGSITGSGQPVTVGVVSLASDRVGLAVEVKASASSTGTWVTNYYETYSGPTIVRGPLRAPSGLEVASLELTLDPGTGSIGATPMRQYAIQGGFNDVRVVVSRSYTTESLGTTTPGLVTLFDGIVSDVQVGSTEINLSVMSVVDKLNEELPRRKYQQFCPYNVYDSDCGLSKAAWTSSSLNVTGTTSTIQITGNYTTDTWKMGTIWFTSGALSGTVRAVMSDADSGGNHIFTVFPPLPIPATGNVSYAYGCSKYAFNIGNKPPSCNDFNNNARYGGFNSIPTLMSTK